MKCASKTIAAALWLAIVLSPAINAQQPESPKKHAPSLTVDSPQMPGSTRVSGVMNMGGAAEGWTRYSFLDTGASVELPGEPWMLGAPDETPRGVFKNFFYSSDGVAVFISYARTPKTSEAWNFVAGWMDGLMREQGVTDARFEGDYNLRAKRVPTKVVGKVKGVPMEFRGIICFINEQKEVLMVLTEFKQANARARAVATRAVDSVEVPN